RDHPRQEPAVEADRAEQVEVELVEPVLFGQRGEAPGRGVRPADTVDEDVYATTTHNPMDDGLRALDGRGVCADEALGSEVAVRERAGGHHDDGTGSG